MQHDLYFRFLIQSLVFGNGKMIEESKHWIRFSLVEEFFYFLAEVEDKFDGGFTFGS